MKFCFAARNLNRAELIKRAESSDERAHGKLVQERITHGSWVGRYGGWGAGRGAGDELHRGLVQHGLWLNARLAFLQVAAGSKQVRQAPETGAGRQSALEKDPRTDFSPRGS